MRRAVPVALLLAAAIIAVVFIVGNVPDPHGVWALTVIGMALIAGALSMDLS